MTERAREGFVTGSATTPRRAQIGTTVRGPAASSMAASDQRLEDDTAAYAGIAATLPPRRWGSPGPEPGSAICMTRRRPLRNRRTPDSARPDLSRTRKTRVSLTVCQSRRCRAAGMLRLTVIPSRPEHADALRGIDYADIETGASRRVALGATEGGTEHLKRAIFLVEEAIQER